MKNVRHSRRAHAGQRSTNISLVRGAIKKRHYKHTNATRGRALEMPKHMRRAGTHAGKGRALAAKLRRCRPGRRCLSPACPECAAAEKTLLASVAERFAWEWVGERPVAFVTLIPPNSLVREGALRALNIANFRRRVRDGLAKTSAFWAVGSVDFTLNEQQDGTREPYWQPHAHLIVATDDIDALKCELRKAFPRSDQVPKPVMVKEWDLRSRVFSYVFKAHFNRRVSVNAQMRFNPRTGKKRICRGSTYKRLRVSERIELALYLDAVGLGGRLLFRNARLYRTEKSVRIQLTSVEGDP